MTIMRYITRVIYARRFIMAVAYKKDELLAAQC